MAAIDVGNVIEKLIQLLRDEVTLLRGVRDKVEAVKAELSLIQAYLKDADAKAETADTSSHAVKEWVKQLREVAFRLEYAVDLYSFRLGKLRQRRRRPRGVVVGVLCKVDILIRSVVPRHKIISEIVSITASLRRLEEEKQAFGLSSSAAENGATNMHGPARYHDLRMSAHFVKDNELVGVEDTKNLLTHWLLTGQTTRTVISVVGEGGLGKTTIVRNVYNKQKENQSFDCYAWITVSRPFDEEHLLKTMIQKLYQNDDKYDGKEITENVMDKDSLTRELREHLQGRSYMIVFDDVWAIDFWGGIEFALPCDSNNSRIIITTRDKGVAEFCQRSARVHIHELQPLHPDDALKLFLLKTFQFDPKGCPKQLEELSKSFVKKCEGVPLAIMAISGLLSTKKKTISEWQKVYDSLRSKFSSDPHLKSFYQVLSESYRDLPYHLKLCLLYFGLFPEDYTITSARLMRLWVAEGFVNENELYAAQTLEEAAEDYLAELIRRSLVKVADIYDNGGVRSCWVHDLMHDFIVRKCEELSFCQALKNQEFRLHEWTRRLSIQKINDNEGDAIEKDQNYSRVRSCISCDIKQLSESTLKSLLSCFKLLVILDLEDSPLDHLPAVIGNLLNLKYLNVRKTKIKTIPKFIGKLQKLQTLNIRDTQVRELPAEINRLVKLRHLLSYSYDFKEHWHFFVGVKLNKGIGCLTALQSLVCVDTTNGNGVIREMENLKNMRRLGIIKLSKDIGNAVCNAIRNMPHLCKLGIRAAEEHEVLELQSVVDPPLHLQRLYLDGCLERLPEWIPKLKHLVRLRLTSSRLAEDPLRFLKGLPELLELYLKGSHEGEGLHFKHGWFEKLKNLWLLRINGLMTIKIENGALPNLEKLWLEANPLMVQVPDDIQNLEALKHVYLDEMPRQFVDDISTRLKENTRLHIIARSETQGVNEEYWPRTDLRKHR